MAQVWPREDTFTLGSEPWNTQVSGYTGMKLTNSNFSYGVLADFDGDNLPYPTRLEADPNTGRLGFVTRRFVDEDVTADLVSVFASSLGTIAQINEEYDGAAVCVRVQGGTLTDGGTTSAHIDKPSCYAFECTQIGVGNLRFELVRYYEPSGGGYLRAPLAATLNVPLVIGINLTQPLGLQLTAVTVGSVVILEAYITNIVVSGVPFQNYPAFVNVIDSSADRLTGSGRVGFALSEDRVGTISPLTGAYFRHKVVNFRASPWGPSTAGDIRDEWKRAAPNQSALITNQLGGTGRCVMSDFVGDQYGKSSAKPLVYGTTYPEVVGTGTSATTRYAFVSQRPPDDPNSQTPELSFQIDTGSGASGTSARQGAGVLARATGNLTTTNLNGYAALAYFDEDASDWQIELRRYNGGTSTLLASGRGDLTGEAQTASITLQLEVAQLNGTPAETGPAVLRVLAAAGGGGVSAQSLTVESVAGLSTSGASFIDASSLRHTTGNEGMFYEQVNGTRPVLLTEFDQGTLVTPGEGEADIPSVAFTAEPSATESINDYADLVLPQPTRANYWKTTSRADSGHLWTRAQERTPRRGWQGVETYPMTESERDAFLAFWRQHATPGRAFNMTDRVLDQTFKVRAVEATLDEQRLHKDAHVFTFDAEEVR